MRPLRIAIAGLGTVGAEVFCILSKKQDGLREGLSVKAVSARNASKNRGLDLRGVDWIDNPLDLVTRSDIDVVIEVMGGADDPAYSLIKSALSNKKHVVTANKALLAKHGIELAALAEQNGVNLQYEAAVAGGIPIIKLLREGLSANDISAVYGILNGTCNYILTAMEETGRNYAEILKEAQSLGYAEADPTLDIGGGDAGQKLSLLTALAFGCQPDFSKVDLQGMSDLTLEDISVANELGFRIKSVGVSKLQEEGTLLQMVSPSLLPKSSPMAHVNGVLNAVMVEGSEVGQSFIAGRGAGAGPTASSVVADLIDIARETQIPVFGKKMESLPIRPMVGRDEWEGEFYIRLSVKDQPGVIAEIAPILRDEGISIETLVQKGRSADQPVSVIIMTHETKGENIRQAIQKIAKLESINASPLVMPVLRI